MQVNEIAEEISESKEMIPQKPKGKEKGFLSAKKRDILFYCLISAFPLLQFSIFYLGVNVNSFLLAFKSYDAFTGVMTWVGFDNIVEALRAMTSQYELVTAAKNSIIAYVCGLVVGVPLALLFSYYIYKKKFLGGFFRVILFLPSILSAIAMSVIFYYFAERALPAYIDLIFGTEIRGLLSNQNTAFGVLVFYTYWIGFGTNTLMYSGAMNSISESVVEAAELDGATPFREFLSITVPLIYPTIVTFLVVGVAGIFTQQLNIYSIYGTGAETYLYTFGYYLYRATSIGQQADYPFLSSLGLLMTIVAAPLTLLVKYLLEKFGPKVD